MQPHLTGRHLNEWHQPYSPTNMNNTNYEYIEFYLAVLIFYVVRTSDQGIFNCW